MKNYHRILLLIPVLLSNCSTENSSIEAIKLSKLDATKIVITDVIGADTLGKSLHGFPYILETDSIIKSLGAGYSVDFESWLFLIDDNYYMDWEHPCRYIFVSIEDGDYKAYNENYYPSIMSIMDTIVIWPLE